MNNDWAWGIATDDSEVHDLLCASDAYHATAAAPAPVRDPATTRRHVTAGAVHTLRSGAALVAMFTLTDTPPHGLDEAVFAPARKPMYLQRLVVRPEWIQRDTLAGVRCVRRAVDVARERMGDVLRAEANPDLEHVHRLLCTLGFQQVGPMIAGVRRKVFLERRLADP